MHGCLRETAMLILGSIDPFWVWKLWKTVSAYIGSGTLECSRTIRLDISIVGSVFTMMPPNSLFLVT